MEFDKIFEAISRIQHQLDKNEISDLKILIAFLVIIIVNIASNYFFTYFRKKGENSATKEDIQEITKKVESVREDYNKNIEEYKKDLEHRYESFSVISQTKVDLYKKLATLRKTIDKRINNIGNEKEQLDYIFKEIPILLIELNSYGFIRNNAGLRSAIENCANEHKLLINKIQKIKNNPHPSGRYIINYGDLLSSIDGLQENLISY